jgi:hypothetical protein
MNLTNLTNLMNLINSYYPIILTFIPKNGIIPALVKVLAL